MELEYHDVTAELDAKEILRYLNNLGIQNISGEVLKYFITGNNAILSLFKKLFFRLVLIFIVLVFLPF